MSDTTPFLEQWKKDAHVLHAHLDAMEHMRKEVEGITGIANLPRERKRSTAEQMALEARLRAASHR